MLLFFKTHNYRKLKSESYTEVAFKHLKQEKKEDATINSPVTEKEQAIEQGRTLLEDVIFSAFEISVWISKVL